MRLDSNGNLGIGTVSPRAKLDVTAGEAVISNGTSSTPSTGGTLWLNTGVAGLIRAAGIQAISTTTANDHSLLFYTNAASASPVERMRIDSGGNLNIGITGFTATRVINQGAYGVYRSNTGTVASPVTDRALAYIQSNNQVYANISFLNTITDNNASWMTFNVTPTGSTTPFEAMRIPAAGGLQVVNCVSVGNATPSTSGAGITFPATQSASSNANTLDDYEEGTFTATIGYDGGSFTASSAQYTKTKR
jgi:hypothetical protein